MGLYRNLAAVNCKIVYDFFYDDYSQLWTILLCSALLPLTFPCLFVCIVERS